MACEISPLALAWSESDMPDLGITVEVAGGIDMPVPSVLAHLPYRKMAREPQMPLPRA